MSLKAVGWLSTKLGIDISGRNSDTASHCSVAGTSSTLGTCFNKLNDAVFGSNNNDGFGKGSDVFEAPFANTGSSNRLPQSPDNVELDENGLPVSKNWYYFDEKLGRWNVSPEAPDSIKAEFQQRLQEEENERTGKNVVLPPPPPPPPPVSTAPGPVPQAPLFAMGKCDSTTPYAHGLHPQGVFGTQQSTSGAHQRVQYAVPDYFGTTAPSEAYLDAQSGNQNIPLGALASQQFPRPMQSDNPHQGQSLWPPAQPAYPYNMQAQSLPQDQQLPHQHQQQICAPYTPGNDPADNSVHRTHNVNSQLWQTAARLPS
ncbi:hypothetical protein ERJ75_000192500 [Trypanosoma vivax]|uniref:Uncharacterized protein n=1 Tax=Trypanosoma vivax (strain Y486) TaxID=1055687 RepID=G0UA51_TRYVY|nr:hypothetical protein ERJ75_000192500 [Trypanosoma vivax]CCC52683.1 conserved hypothetical protein [Trypanosoma vivax Y486]